jgi:hypothetical protein
MCLGEDIGFVDPVVPVSNEFFWESSHSQGDSSEALKTADRDIICVDSCHTGLQYLQYVGSRYGKRMPEPSYPNFYVTLDQGIYTSSTHFVRRPPIVRLGMCGTLFLRVGNVVDASAVPSGDVVGFFSGVIFGRTLEGSISRCRQEEQCVQDPTYQAQFGVSWDFQSGSSEAVPPSPREIHQARLQLAPRKPPRNLSFHPVCDLSNGRSFA